MSAHRHIYSEAVQAAEACGRHIFSLLETALAGEDDVSLAISGGSTPLLMFQNMAQARFDWSRVHLFWVDERNVPPTHADSNYGMTEEVLIRPARIPHRNVHRIHGELAPPQAARHYQHEIREIFRLEEGELPRKESVAQHRQECQVRIVSLLSASALGSSSGLQG